MNTVTTVVAFPLPTSTTPSSPSVLLGSLVVLSLFNSKLEEGAAPASEVTDAVKESFTAQALELGWKSVVFTGDQVMLSSIDVKVSKGTKVGKGNSATPSFDDIASFNKMDKFEGVI